MKKISLSTLIISLLVFVKANAVDINKLEDKYISLFKEKDKDAKSILNVVKEVRNDFRTISKTKKMAPADTKANLDMEVCVDCKEINKLTTAINDIIAELPETKDPTSEVSLELNNLIAVTTLHEFIVDNERTCFQNTDPSLSDEFSTLDKSDLVLQFSQLIDTHFTTGQFYSKTSEHKIIWLRGSGKDIDKVVRVDIDRENNRRVSFYTLKNVAPNTKVKKKKEVVDYNIPDLKNAPVIEEDSLEERSSGNIDLAADLQWKSDSGKDYLKMTVGPQVNYKYYVPSEVTILDIQTENEVFKEYLVRSNLHVDSKDQEAKITVLNANSKEEVIRIKAQLNEANVQVPYDQELVDVYKVRGKVEVDTLKGETLTASLYDSSNNNALLNITARKERVNLGVPYEAPVYDDYTVGGVLSTDNLGTHRATASIRNGNSELFNTQFTKHSSGNESYSLSSKRKVAETGTLSLKLQRDRLPNTNKDTVWVNYEMKF